MQDIEVQRVEIGTPAYKDLQKARDPLLVGIEEYQKAMYQGSYDLEFRPELVAHRLEEALDALVDAATTRRERLAPPLVLYTGSRDGMIPPTEADKVRALLPSAELQPLDGLGHLAHEEDPDRVAALLVARSHD